MSKLMFKIKVKRLIKSLKRLHDLLGYIGSESCSEEELEFLYSQSIQVKFLGHRVNIPFSAEVYHSLVNLVETAEKEV